MIPLNTIRTETERVKNGLAKKHFPNVDLVDEIITLDNQRRSLQTSRDDLQNKMNELSRQIGIFIKNKNFDEANKIKDETASIKIEIQEKEVILKEIESKINNILVLLPNIPHESVPEGKTADDNVIVKNGGVIPTFDFTALPHWQLAEKYDLIDFSLGSKITGAGFPIYKKWGAKLQRALIQFFLDKAWENGYTEIEPPLLVNQDSAFADRKSVV